MIPNRAKGTIFRRLLDKSYEESFRIKEPGKGSVYREERTLTHKETPQGERAKPIV
jgi:hypothetical protein